MPKGTYIRTEKHKALAKSLWTPERKLQMSAIMKGNKNGEGRVMSQEQRDYVRTWVFKGGSESYWKLKAKIRDHFTCRSCSLYDPEIVEADHTLPKNRFPELSCVLENLVTLCPNCHRRKTIRQRGLTREELLEKRFKV